MELTSYSSSYPKTEAPFLPLPKHYLSTADAHATLKGKKVVLLQKDDTFSCGFTSMTAFVALTVVCCVGAVFGFLVASNTHAHIDHSRDVKTSFQAREIGCMLHSELISPDCFFINHTQDVWVPNIDAGIKTAIPVATVPPFAVLLIWKIMDVAWNNLTKYKNHTHVKNNDRINDLLLSLHCSLDGSVGDPSEISDLTPAPSKLIATLYAHDCISDNNLAILSFDQINSIRKSNPAKFKTLLNGESFSPDQNSCWKKLTKMLSAAAADLVKAINNSNNSKFFIDEPLMLEVLIQELADTQMTEDLKNALCLKLRGVNELLAKLEKQEMLQIIDLVSKRKYSLEEAYQRRASFFGLSDKTINIELTDTDNNLKSLTVPVGLLTASSSVFKNALEDCVNHEKESFKLGDVDPAVFEALITYLKTDEIAFETVNLFALLALADKYDFTNLHQSINSWICDHLDLYLGSYDLEFLLNLCKEHNLNSFKKMIDLKLSSKLPWLYEEGFLETAERIRNFDLKISRHKLRKSIEKTFKELVKEPLSIELFVDRFIQLIQVEAGWLEKLWALFIEECEENPLLLGALFERASNLYVDVILDKIIAFCQEPDNAHLYLANWKVPPVKQKMGSNFEVIDFSTEI